MNRAECKFFVVVTDRWNPWFGKVGTVEAGDPRIDEGVRIQHGSGEERIFRSEDLWIVGLSWPSVF